MKQLSKKEALSIQSFSSKVGQPSTIASKKSALSSEGRDFNELYAGAVLSYISKGGDRENFLNGAVRNTDDVKIVCRHLSFFVASRRMKDYHSSLESESAIGRQTELMHNIYDSSDISIRSKYYNVFSLNTVGVQLKNIAEHLESGQEVSLLFNGCKHTMAITIRNKIPGAYIIKIYDPALTNVHKRIMCKNLRAIAQLTITDLLHFEELENLYFPKFKTGVLFSPNIIDSHSIPFVEVHEPKKDRALYNILRFGLVNEMHQVINGILERSDIGKIEKKCLLAAKLKDGTPGFYRTMRFGLTNTVTAFVSAVLDSKLTNAQKVELLMAKDGDEEPALYAAIMLNKTKSVTAFVSAVLDSNLTSQNKVALLSAKCVYTEESDESNESDEKIESEDSIVREEPALYAAIDENNIDSVKAFVRAVLSSTKLSNEEKVKLLKAENSDGKQGLSLAKENESTDIITFMENEIRNSSLTISQKESLGVSLDSDIREIEESKEEETLLVAPVSRIITTHGLNANQTRVLSTAVSVVSYVTSSALYALSVFGPARLTPYAESTTLQSASSGGRLSPTQSSTESAGDNEDTFAMV